MTTTDLYHGVPDPDISPEFYADVPSKRFLAWIMDTMLICILTAVLVPFTAFTALFYLPFLFFAVSLFYRIVSLARRSATPGMRFMAIEFRTGRGDPFDLVTATIHSIAFMLSASTFIIQIVSMILMLTTPRKQGLTDHFLGTVAVNRMSAY